MPWNDVKSRRNEVDLGLQTFGNASRGPLADIVTAYHLTEVQLPLPAPRSGNDFNYSFNGLIPPDSDLVHLVSEAMRLGYKTSEAIQTDTTQTTFIAKGDVILASVYAVHGLQLGHASGAGKPAKVSFAHTTSKLTPAAQGLINSLATIYGFNMSAGTP